MVDVDGADTDVDTADGDTAAASGNVIDVMEHTMDRSKENVTRHESLKDWPRHGLLTPPRVSKPRSGVCGIDSGPGPPMAQGERRQLETGTPSFTTADT